MNILLFLAICISSLWASPIKNFPSKGSRIHGGDDAVEAQFPWQVTLDIDESYFCGGALLSQEWILTSASCVDNYTSFTAALGSTNLNDGADVYNISKVVIHDGYDGDPLVNNVALLKTDGKVKFSRTVHSVIISENSLDADIDIVVSGFGKLNDDDAGFSDDLQWITLTTLTNDDCSNIYNGINENLVCASSESDDKGICAGDLGGAAVIYDGYFSLLVGISTARTSEGCDAGGASIFTRVEPFLDWISDTMNSE